MRVLVTGGAGYIGSHVVHDLAARGHEVTVLDDLSRGHAAAIPGHRLVVGDIGDRGLVARLLEAESIEAVVHCAARKSVAESMADPGGYFRTNVGGSLALLEAMVDTGVRQLVVSSTCAVYGDLERVPVDEAAPIHPANPYGESKALMERMTAWFDARHGLRTITLRYFNAAGAALDGNNGEDWTGAENLVPLVMQVAAGRRPVLDVYGTDYPTPDGTAIRDFVHVLDLAEAHALAIDHLAAGHPSVTLNLGTGTGASVLEVVAAAREVTGRPIPIREAPRRAGDPPAVWADARLARSVLGWTPGHDLASIVATAWRWHERNPDGHGSARLAGSGAAG
jgi:UDP-glucose 4-epimerase